MPGRGKRVNRKSPDAVSLDDSRNLPLRLQISHGAKRYALPRDIGGDVGIAHIVEVPPLVLVQPEQNIHLTVTLPERRYRRARERACQLLRDGLVGQAEAICLFGPDVHAGHPGIGVVVITRVGRQGHVAQNAFYLVAELFQDRNIAAGNADFDWRFDLRALLQLFYHHQCLRGEFLQLGTERFHQCRRVLRGPGDHDDLAVARVRLLRVHVVVKPGKALAGKTCHVFYNQLFHQELLYSFDHAIGFFEA